MDRYTAVDYWSSLHEGRHDESTVGYPGLPVSLNKAMYGALRESVGSLVDAHAPLHDPGRVLDVGAGTGIWVDFWKRHGAREVVGIDLAEASVRALQDRFPKDTFVAGDVSAETLPVDGAFDVISVMSVLLHVTDDERWARALRNLHDLLEPGGHLIVIDAITAHDWYGPPVDPTSSSRARPLAEYREGLRAAGFELVELRPATVVLSNVGDTRSRYTFAAMWRAWGLLSQLTHGRERVGTVAGAVLKTVDRPLRRMLPHGPSAKLLLARRPPA